MTHHLSDITIRNFKSIKSVRLRLSSFTPLIGQNNVGKSNILSAISWLIKPVALEPSHCNSPSLPIEVEATIQGITEDLLQNSVYKKHADRIAPYLKDGRLTIKRILPCEQWKASEAKIHVSNPDTGEFEVNPTGIDAALKNLFPEPVRIEAMVDAPEDVAKCKTTSTLGKIIALLTEPLAKKHGDELTRLLDRLGDSLSAEGSKRATELKFFDAEASKVLQSYFPGLEIVIDFPTPKLPELLKTGTVKIKEGAASVGRQFTELGHGAQRCIQMAMVQLLAMKSQVNDATLRCTLLLIDEPELYLHPQAIEQVRLSLKRLAEAGYQVIFSTHSPLFVGRTDAAHANIILKRSLDEGTISNQSARESVERILIGDSVSQAKTLFELSNAKELLFSERVLLVEGHTEPEIVPHLYEYIMGRTLAADKIGVVKLSGCNDLSKAMKILSGMGIAACGLVDLDYAFVGAVPAGYVEAEHPALALVKSWFAANVEQLGLVLQNGWPTNKSRNRAEGAFLKMAEDAQNSSAIHELRAILLQHRIWVWPIGSIEQIVGLPLKNDPDAIAELCSKLDQADTNCLAHPPECREFCRWLQRFESRELVQDEGEPTSHESEVKDPNLHQSPLPANAPCVQHASIEREPSNCPPKPEGVFRVIHTADWHLGKMLGDHSREEEHGRFLAFLLEQIRQLSIDALIIAGDVFDSANPAQSAEAQYFDFLSNLYRQGGCSVVIVAGNHDSPAHLDAPRRVLKALGAHVIGSVAADTSDLIIPLPSPESPKLIVAAVPFLRDRDLRIGQSGQGAKEIQNELVLGIRKRYSELAAHANVWKERGIPVLATGHLTVVGCRVSESEREIHIGGLGAFECDGFPETFSYVALGHLHRPQRAGHRDTIRYSGSPIPLSFSEANDRKEIRVLDFQQGDLIEQTRVEIPIFRQLAQIRCRRDTLEQQLKAFSRGAGDLQPWVELIIEDPPPGENLYETARGFLSGDNCELIRVVATRTTAVAGTTAGEEPDLNRIEDFLANPAKVFEHRLSVEPSLVDEERIALKTAFAELCNRHAELQREGHLPLASETKGGL